MVECGHGRMGVGLHEACNRAPRTLADTGVEFAASALWMPPGGALDAESVGLAERSRNEL